jgi:hypothetical protein
MINLLPFKGTFTNNIHQSQDQHSKKDKHFKESRCTHLTPFGKIHCPWIHENDLYIEQDKKNGDEEIFYRKGKPRISLEIRFHTQKLPVLLLKYAWAPINASQP